MLRQPLRANPQRRQTAVGRSIPAPTGGWNASTPLARMSPKDAVILDNWIPRSGDVEMRRGSLQHAASAPATVETLMVYRDASDELYAVSDGDVYDVTAQGSVFTSPVYTGLSNSRTQWTNFSNDGGRWIIACNGADTPFKYDGSAWGTLTITGSSGSVTLTATDLIDVMAHKRRLFFTEKDSLRIWYLSVNAIQGSAGLLDLGPICAEGGTIACMGTWSLDSGQGPDDLAVFVTTEGQAAVYQGNDPSDANDWALVGVFSIGRPIGRRGLLKFGGDLNILTTDGVLPASQALRRDRAQDDDVAITAKIRDAFSQAVAAYESNFGWQGITYPGGSLAIYNIPVTGGAHQYVQNLQTGAWCRFTGLDAACWAGADNGVYFGAADGVYQWDVGVSDDGTDLTADLKTAFNYFGDPARLKQFVELRPTLNATQSIQPAIEVLTDFAERAPTSVPTNTITADEGLQIRDNWASVTGLGYCAAVRMQVKVTADATVNNTLGDGAGDEIGDGSGNTMAVDSGFPIEAQVRVIAFNVLYQPGGQM